MKKHIKNLIATIAVATFLLGGGSAFASGFIGSYSGTLPPSELTTGYTHYLVKDNGIQPYFYYYNGNLSYGTNPAMPPFQPNPSEYITFSGDYLKVYYVDETFGTDGTGTGNINIQANASYYSDQSLVFPNPNAPTPPATIRGISIFGGHTHATGSVTAYTGTAMIGQTATALHATMDGIAPIGAVVIGLILTFIVIGFIINMTLRSEDATADKKKISVREPHLVRKSQGLWIRE